MKKDSIQTRKRKPKQSGAQTPSPQTSQQTSSHLQPYSIPLKLTTGMTTSLMSGQHNSNPKLVSARNYPNFNGLTSLNVQSSAYPTTSYYTLNDMHSNHHMSPPLAHHHHNPSNTYSHSQAVGSSLSYSSPLATADLMSFNSLSGGHPYQA